ncbi:MAG TPA: malto-oligosyltrehalose trehalohydrolase [Thermoanaerobaculia bacterium]|nr:malto-oligosyltrehalose trehalohydrolase [Thermoanaerobaculia bacterium]
MSPYQGKAQGAFVGADGTTVFRIWAPRHEQLHLEVDGQLVPMDRDDLGFFAASHPAPAGTRYRYRVGEAMFPDPASRFQPDGPHGPAAVVDPRYPWTDEEWRGVRLEDAVIYELHVGTFSEAGTFEGIIPHLPRLEELGVTLIEIMPVSQFPGTRNWGYDGAFPNAVQNSYGGPAGLRALVDAAHRAGLGICLDVVYNHLGPDGNYLEVFGPYFTDAYSTPWGKAVNFDGAESDAVRELFIQNALMWIEEFHVDALRLDAVHAIFDQSAYPFLHELADRVHEAGKKAGRQVLVFPESDLNDPRMVRPAENGGYGMDAHWNDDFHHSLHALLTGESTGYYADFGKVADLAAVFESSYAYARRYSPHRRRRHGNLAQGVDGCHFIVATQNHDQVGNRMNGERLTALVSFDELKVAAVTLLLSPFVPLIFMGEEYGEKAPFLYFVDHQNPELVEAVRKGRREEFAAFSWQGEPPDPQSEETFAKSRLNASLTDPMSTALWNLYRELISLRGKYDSLGPGKAGSVRSLPFEGERALVVIRGGERSKAVIALNFSAEPSRIQLEVPSGTWLPVLDTTAPQWLGAAAGEPGPLQAGRDAAISLPPRAAIAWVSEESS